MISHMQESLSFKILNSVSSACGVSPELIQSNSKQRNVANARRISCVLMSEVGIRGGEIARLLGCERSSVHSYISTHPKWMEDSLYNSSYEKAKDFAESYTEDNKDLSKEVSELKLKVRKLEDMLEHIKTLILN